MRAPKSTGLHGGAGQAKVNIESMGSRRIFGFVANGLLVGLTSLSGNAQVATPQQASAAIGKYCATCHSAQVHTAGMVLEPAALSNVRADAER